MIAALFVAEDGPYIGLEGVDAWTKERDARLYRGPHPVVAHPPCDRWGRYWSGGPSARERRLLGDDGGCFAAALWAVRTFGGVIEHPASSHAWTYYGLPKPDPKGGWTEKDRYGGRACQVEQGHYGHRARKATFLYYVGGATPPELKWGQSQGVRLEEGFHSSEERARARARCRYCADQANQCPRKNPHAPAISRSALSYCRAREIGLVPNEFLSRRQRMLTPVEFRNVLMGIARASLLFERDET